MIPAASEAVVTMLVDPASRETDLGEQAGIRTPDVVERTAFLALSAAEDGSPRTGGLGTARGLLDASLQGDAVNHAVAASVIGKYFVAVFVFFVESLARLRLSVVNLER